MNVYIEQVKAILEEENMIAALSNLSAFIKQEDDGLNWAGFYFVTKTDMVLGPFQGKVACTHIPFTKGVLGSTYRSNNPQRIDNVHAIKDHIACDSASNSELCVPVYHNKQMVLIIDLDSSQFNHFTKEDEEKMLQVATCIEQAILQHSWY